MPTTRILYSQTTQLGKQVAQAVNAILEARTHVRRVLPILNSSSSGADYTALAAELGGGLTALQAQDLWTIFSTASGNVDNAQIAELSRLDQG